MKDKDMRVRIPLELYNNYKKLCIDRGLSLPRQTAQLIKAFMQMQTQEK